MQVHIREFGQISAHVLDAGAVEFSFAESTIGGRVHGRHSGKSVEEMERRGVLGGANELGTTAAIDADLGEGTRAVADRAHQGPQIVAFLQHLYALALADRACMEAEKFRLSAKPVFGDFLPTTI